MRWERGYWAAVPQVRNGKVTQCVLVAQRMRAGKTGEIATAFSINIGRGADLAFGINDDDLRTESILDDRAEVMLDDGRNIPAVAFNVTDNAYAIHSGDAAAVLSALEKSKPMRLHSTGAGFDTGTVELNVPADAIGWLKASTQPPTGAIDIGHVASKSVR